jgi:hypothetical protein
VTRDRYWGLSPERPVDKECPRRNKGRTDLDSVWDPGGLETRTVDENDVTVLDSLINDTAKRAEYSSGIDLVGQAKTRTEIPSVNNTGAVHSVLAWSVPVE